jgi:hypothetical protein
VRRAKLYYLRGRSGKSARIAEKDDGFRPRAKARVSGTAAPSTEAAPPAATEPVEETAKGAKGGKKKAVKAKKAAKAKDGDEAKT